MLLLTEKSLWISTRIHFIYSELYFPLMTSLFFLKKERERNIFQVKGKSPMLLNLKRGSNSETEELFLLGCS